VQVFFYVGRKPTSVDRRPNCVGHGPNHPGCGLCEPSFYISTHSISLFIPHFFDGPRD